MWKALFALRICTAGCELLRCQIAQCAVRAYLVVVVDPPGFDDLSGAVQREEPVFVEVFLAELAVEAFDVAVPHRLTTRHDEVQHDLVFVGPSVERCKYPPAEPVALRLLAPQRGLTATVRSKSKNKSKSLVLLSSLPQHRQFEGEHTPGILKVLLPPRQRRGISLSL